MAKPLHTIGYEGSSIDEFVRTISRSGIDLLIDVRELPLSRKRGFSKRALCSLLASHEIEYLHLRGLGDPKPGRLAAREGRYTDFRRIFSAHLRTQIAQMDLQKGIDAARTRSACLLCFERDHKNCHRCIVAEEMAKHGKFKLIHLGIVNDVGKGILKESTRVNTGNSAYIG